MSSKVTVMGPQGPQKTPGWHSWRHRTSEAQTAAREAFLARHGRKARQRSAKERAAAFAALSPAEQREQMRRNRERAQRGGGR